MSCAWMPLYVGDYLRDARDRTPAAPSEGAGEDASSNEPGA
jgi:hypothetical protein